MEYKWIENDVLYLHYKGYLGPYKYDQDTQMYYGKANLVNCILSYEGANIAILFKAFKQEIDDYLAYRNGVLE